MKFIVLDLCRGYNIINQLNGVIIYVGSCMTPDYHCRSSSDPELCSFSGSYSTWEEFAVSIGLTIPPSSSLENANYEQLRDTFVSSRSSWVELASLEPFNLQVSVEIVLQGVLFVTVCM